LKDTRD